MADGGSHRARFCWRFLPVKGEFSLQCCQTGQISPQLGFFEHIGLEKIASVGLLKFGLLFTTFDRFLESIHRQILSKIVFSVSQKSKNLHTSKDFVHSYHRFISF
ncbi:hypothetical protein ILYODFUR_033870 [Ilyodon furcidens]|uniref:Uncharacterized protein n=1 Tax=Ilyodon furcidens TaxID=33524 RepID=A0ABV0TGV3_9TELE